MKCKICECDMYDLGVSFMETRRYACGYCGMRCEVQIHINKIHWFSPRREVNNGRK